MKVKHYELVEIAKDFLKNYELELDIPIQFNNRIKKVLGRFSYNRKNGENIPEKIEMSIDFMLSHPREHIIDVFKHELVHYALCVKKMPFSDGDWHFENELKKYGISSTNSYKLRGEHHKYICCNCGKIYERKRQLSKTAFCGCSSSPNLKYQGIINK